MSMPLSRVTAWASLTTFALRFTSACARSTALSATIVMRMARPARRWISSALRWSTSQVPPPTVPMPRSPTLIGFISLQSEFEVFPDGRPFPCEDAVHHGIADAAVAPRRVVAQHPVLLGPERLDRALRAEVEVV